VDTMQAILRQEAAELPEAVPAGLRQIVAHCLEKAPENRFQSARDLSFSLAALAQSGSHASLAPVRSARRKFFVPMVAVLITAVVSIAAGWLYWRPEPPPPFDVLTRVTADPGLTTDPALSPDGKMIAYASDRGGDGGLDIWIQTLANGEAVRLTNDPSDDRQPAFSSDGSTIVFRSERDRGGIYTIPSLGGVARLLVSEGYDPQYSPDGQSIAYWTGPALTSFPARGWIYSINGRTQRQIRPDFARVTHPIWSPDGKSIIFEGSPKLEQIGAASSYDWWITPVATGSAAQTGALAYLRKQGLQSPKAAAWLPSNEILSSASAGNALNIWRIPVSRSLRVERRPVRVTIGTQRESHPSATRDNLVSYAAENSATEIWGLDLRPGAAGAHHELVRLAGGTGTNIRPSISRDGNTMAYISNSTGGSHVWISSLTRGIDRALTGASRPEYWPVLSRDGTKVAFTTWQYPTEAQSRAGLPLLIAEVRTGVPQAVCPNCSRPEDWSADGHKLLLGSALPSDGAIAEFDLEARKHTILIKDSHHDIVSPRYSPDGKWVSFHERTGPDTRRLWIAPLEEAALPIPATRWTAITDNSTVDREARWSDDGSWLYFASNRDGFQCIWAQRLDPSSKRPTGPAVPVHHFHSALLGLTVADSGLFGMSVGAGRMVVALGATTGNVWLIRRP
jgi:eukaryotic-like serine/threonine-protein kinase